MNVASLFPENPHRLLISLFVLSLGIHLLAVYIGGGWRSERPVYIEFALRDASLPMARSIPRPRIRETIPAIRNAPNLSSRKSRVIPVESAPVSRPDIIRQQREALPDIPGIPDITGLNTSDWAGVSGFGNAIGDSGGITRKDYFEMVRLKIESRKKYPEVAKARQIEGRVTVGFTLDTGGQIESVTVVKSSGHANLDQAAVKAIKSAAPFPQPPPGLFKDALQMTIVIAFELT